jgi:hypothetical protein
MAGQGYSYCGRYISLSTPELSGDLSGGEVEALTENGIAILVAQHPRGGANGGSQGILDAETAISNLNSLGAPSGLFVYCDVENFTTFNDAVAYATAWGNKVNASGLYKPGFYGAANILAATTASWHGLWENTTCFGGALPGANISQGPEACNGSFGDLKTCGGQQLRVDYDTAVTNIGGFWGA